MVKQMFPTLSQTLVSFVAFAGGYFPLYLITGGPELVPRIFFSFTLAAALSSFALWLLILRVRGVTPLWLVTPVLLIAALFGVAWLAPRLGLPLFYLDPPRWAPGEGGRPLWTLGWWTSGTGLAGCVTGLAQWKLLGPHGTWHWVLFTTIAWASVGATLWWPFWPARGPDMVVELLLGSLSWSFVSVIGLRMLAARARL
jgi:hypothetical protein